MRNKRSKQQPALKNSPANKKTFHDFHGRMQWVKIFASICFVSVLVRVGYLQIWEGDHYGKLARKHQERKITLESQRGSIYDRQGNILSVSVMTDSIHAFPKKIESPYIAGHRLGALLDQEPDTLIKRLRSKRSFIWLKRQTSPRLAKQVKALDLEGIQSIKEYRRYYPLGDFAGHLLGFTGMDSQGLEGLEYQYHSLLYGGKRSYLIEQDGTHRRLPNPQLSLEKPPNYDLNLTLDSTIQYYAETALAKGIEKMDAKGGLAIVMESQTGALLAMAQAPGFDPNRFRSYSRYHFLNRAVSSGYEPGSTFKLITIAAALEAGVLQSDELIDCEGGAYRIADKTLRDLKKHNELTIGEIIKYSSNIGAAKIGMRMPSEYFYEVIQNFGFGAKLGIGLSGEATGRVLSPKQWTVVDHASISFGHGILVSPIQLIAAVNVMAAEGKYYHPYLVDHAKDAAGEELHKVRHPNTDEWLNFGPKPYRTLISPKTANQVKHWMRSVIQDGGTGTKAAVDGFEVAGKTGTSEVFDEKKRRYSKDKHIAFFVGFAPQENPVLTTLVVVEYPKKSAYGGTAAGPIFSEIMQKSLLFLNQPPQDLVQQHY